MAAQPQNRLLESPTDVHTQITQKLSEDGLDPESSEVEKLLFLWKIYQHVEDDLQKARETEKKLKEAQAEEMKEVENYVEHIRHLSDEREALIQELETENEALKAQVVSLEQGGNEAAQAEIVEMLTQQGLAEISDATQSEQIAYLLVERARLLDELEEHNNSSSNNSPNNESGTSESELRRILEQERHDFEEELGQQRESAKMNREQLKQEHEEEINALMEENSKLEEDLQKAEMMVSQLKAELSQYTDKEEGDGSPSSNLNQFLKDGSSEEDKKKLADECNQLNREREELEKEMGEIEKDRTQLKKEKEEFNQEKAAFDKEKSTFGKEKTKLEQLKSEIEEEKKELVYEKEAQEREKKLIEKKEQDLENKRADLEQEQEEFNKEKEAWEKENKDSPRAQSLRNGSPSRSSNDMALRKIIEEKTKIEGEMVQLKTKIRGLQKEKDAHDDVVYKLKSDLEKSHLQQQQLQVKNRAIKAELQELETQLDEAETSMDSISKEKQSLSEKCDTLNSEVKALRADAMKSVTLQDIVDILNNDKKQLTETVESLKGQLEQAGAEKTELANQNSCLSKEQQDLTNQLHCCKEELEKVTKERDQLSGEKHELVSVTHKQEEVERLLRADLEEMGKAKEKFVNQTETLSKENKDLLNRLDRTREELESAKVKLQELVKQQVVIDHLKDQNKQLQHQLETSHEEIEKSKNRETMLISTQQSLQKSHDDTEKRYTHEIDDLKVKLELTLQELAKSKKQCEQVEQDKSSLAETLKRTEQLLHDSAEVKDILEEEMRQKNNMKLELNRVQLQLAEKTLLADKFEDERKQRIELESQVGSLRDVEESLKVISRELEKEQKMRKSLENHTEELETTISARVSREELLAAQDQVNKERQLCDQLEARVKELERTLKEGEISSESAAEQLENERKLRLSLENNVKELQVALTQQGSAEEVTRLREELSKERAAVKDLEESKEDVQLLCGELEKERTLRAELTRKVAELEAANGETPSSTLKATLDELERERRARAECDMRLQEAEQLLEDQRMDSDNLHHSMSTKVMSLEKRVQALQDDLFTAQDELQAFQERYDEVVKEAEAARQELVRVHTQRNSQSIPLSRSQRSSLGAQQDDEPDSGVTTSGKLQDTLNELNTVKSQLCEAQEELETSQVDLDNSRQEVELLKQSLEMATNHLERSDDELRSLRRELAETQGTLEFMQTQLREKQSKLDSVVQDRDEIQRELDTMCDEQQQRVTPRPVNPALYGEEERQEHVDRISTLEKLSRQLELDNREMARKLSDTMSKCESMEDQLQREKLKTSDKYQQNSRYTDQLEHDIESANKHIRQLREELQQHQTKVFKLEADNLGLSAKYESTIARLEQDNKDLKHRHRQELDSLSERMETSSAEARELRGQKREMEQELTQQRSEVSRLKSNNDRLENHLQAETKQKTDLENRNSVMDNEMTKVWSQVRSLMEKNAELESTNRSLEQDLNTKRSTIRQVETTLSQKEATYEASTKAVVARAEAAEKKARDLQRELEDVTHKMLTVERQLAQSDTGKIQLEDTKDKLVTIRNQLEGEKLQRTLLDQTVAELKHQVALLKQREAKVSTENKELQHTILDLESRLNNLQDKTDTGYESPALEVENQMSEMGKRSLMDQIARLQREVKELQYELYNVSERRDVDVKRYEERKLRTKAKLMKAREFYTTERSKCLEHMKHMDEDLRLTRATLAKELEWREKMDDSYKQLLREKRDLITQLSEAEEAVRDKSRLLSMAQVRVKYLEEETSRLQDRLQTVSQQKHSLDKMMKDYSKREKNRVMSPVDQTGGTSGLGNSLDSAWDPHDRMDSFGQSWSSHIDPPANFRKTGGTGTNVDGSSVDSEERTVFHNTKNSNNTGNRNINFIPNSGGVVLYPNTGGDYALYSETDDKEDIEFL